MKWKQTGGYRNGEIKRREESERVGNPEILGDLMETSFRLPAGLIVTQSSTIFVWVADSDNGKVRLVACNVPGLLDEKIR